NCEKAKGAVCWHNAWQKRDARCGEEIGKEDDKRFSFEHLGGRCYCCPPPDSEEEEEKSEESEEKSEPEKKKRKSNWADCVLNCDLCEAAERASACWIDWRKRDERADCVLNCDLCEAAERASACWIDWRKRDERCGSEIGRVDDRRFSFPTPFGGERCYCCPT
ncbi:hypothetical protein PFISCL1PPCAC_18227, partial [Pristionchus fissidentatus]